MQIYNFLIFINVSLPPYLDNFLQEMEFANFQIIQNPFQLAFDLGEEDNLADYKLGDLGIKYSTVNNSG